METILNPEKLGYQFQTFKSVWDLVLEKNAQNESYFIVEFLVRKPVIYLGDIGKVITIKWKFDMQYLKAKCFDEAINLPYKMDEEVMSQAFCIIGTLQDQFRLTNLSKWLENIALQERDNFYLSKKIER
jgi:hypothetical protein